MHKNNNNNIDVNSYYNDPVDNYLISNQPQAQEQTIRWQIDPQEVLNDIKMQLMGVEYIEGEGLVQVTEPLLCKEGIGSITILLRGHLSHNTVLAVLNENRVLDITIRAAKVVNGLLLMKTNWRVPSENIELIINIVEDSIYTFLTRTIGGGERDSVRGIQKFVETTRAGKGLNPFKKQVNEGLDYGY